MANVTPGDWSKPYNFGAIGQPVGFTVRYMYGNEHWYYLPDDDEEKADGIYSSPHQARRYALAHLTSQSDAKVAQS